MTAAVTAVTQQQAIIVVSLPADLASLEHKAAQLILKIQNRKIWERVREDLTTLVTDLSHAMAFSSCSKQRQT